MWVLAGRRGCEARHRSLFGGDTINTGLLYAQFHDSDVETFAKSATRLAELKDAVSMIAVNHFGRTTAVPYLLQEIADGLNQLLAGTVPITCSVDCLGEGVSEAVFDLFSILMAPEAAPSGHGASPPPVAPARGPSPSRAREPE